jgi:hypothetical protein
MPKVFEKALKQLEMTFSRPLKGLDRPFIMRMMSDKIPSDEGHFLRNTEAKRKNVLRPKVSKQ